jgi:hypothetical protein
MKIPQENPTPNTTVPRDDLTPDTTVPREELTKSEVGGRSAEPDTTVPKETTGTTVPRDDA